MRINKKLLVKQDTGNWINCQTPPGDAVVVVSDPQSQPQPVEPFIPNILWPFLIAPDGGAEAGLELWKKWLTLSPIISDRSAPPSSSFPSPLSPHPPSSSKMIPCLSSIRKNKKSRLNLDLDLGNGNGNGNDHGNGNGDGREGNDENLASGDEIADGKKEEEEKDGRLDGYDYCYHGTLIQVTTLFRACIYRGKREERDKEKEMGYG